MQITTKEMFVVTSGCGSRVKLAAFTSEREAYALANALDGYVDHIPLFSSYREARQDNDIKYEMERTRGAE